MLSNLKCKPGAYVEIVPVGLMCTLQYNSNGILEKIIRGFNAVNHTDADVFDSALTLKLNAEKKIPSRIPFKQGTTWVKGVFYTQKLFKRNGVLPTCVQSDMLKDIGTNLDDYTFYAADMNNDSYTFPGGGLVSTRMSSFGFTVLPGYHVFDDLKEFPVMQVMKDKKSPFRFPYISGLMIYESCNPPRYISAQLSQYTVNNASEYIEAHGYLRCVLELKSRTADVPYSQMVAYNVSPKTLIILDGDNIIGSQRPSGLFNTSVSRDKNCSICGRKMIVPHEGQSYCLDAHCPSRMYPYINRFLTVLGLEPIVFNEYQSLIKEKQITCLLDVFSLDAYKDAIVETTLSKLLFAATPIDVCSNEEFFQRFVNYLGSIEALDFYLQNPDAIVSDLNLNKMYARNVAEWLKDPANLLTIKSLITMPEQIKIKQVSKKFQGAPIFRDKTICLTGKFKHGTLEDVISILQSYSAKVTTKFDNTVNCVVVGHYEGEDKTITDLAVSYNVPIYGEDDFFSSYEIDLDIRKQRDELNAYLK